ncbi:MAG: outer membrane beta-barrel family protein [Flavobacteriaceae bacterium]
MNIKLLALFLFFGTITLAQENAITGTIVDINNTPLSFVNVLLFDKGGVQPLKGTASDDNGNFSIESISEGEYRLEFSMVGFITQTQSLLVSKPLRIPTIIMQEDREALGEVIITTKQPTIQKTAGRLVFQVENTSLSTGNTLNLLSKTPGVLVLGENISIKNQPTTIYLNGRRIYLSTAETVSFLQNLDAAIIKQVEVITNPSSHFDAESSTVLNIITSKAIIPGYKGVINGNYEQAIFSKYAIGTSHYVKNNWLHLYGSYSFSPRKENKDQESYIRFFEPDETTPSAIWESDFNRITKSYGHQGNIVADIDFDKKNALNVTANIFVSPNKEFNNHQSTTLFNAQKQIDSTFFTKSELELDVSNITLGTEYKTTLDEAGSLLILGGNHIRYASEQKQELKSDYFLPNGDFLKSIQFETLSQQTTDIISSYLDVTTMVFQGTLETGLKYSNIDTKTGLAFFDIAHGNSELNTALSDEFTYKESIFAGYLTFEKKFKKGNFNLGTRIEHTNVKGVSDALGSLNTQRYFNFFPSASLEYQVNENSTVGANYARKIERPRYQSLNPFRYFLNENNFNEGNPNLVPSIEDKITLSYSYKEKWFLEWYYQTIDNSLEILNFQNNESFTFRQQDANLISFFQYGFDAVYAAPIKSWWYGSYITSTYYLENEFFAVESTQERYKNHTLGFFAQTYNQFTLSKEIGFTSDVSARYISNLISGSLAYKNIFDVSISFRKTLWEKKGSITTGIDDIFNTNNILIVSRYFNQDNSYLARPETRKFWVGFKYSFGNHILRENQKTIKTKEGERLQ